MNSDAVVDRYERFSKRRKRKAKGERYVEIDEAEGRRKDGDVGSDMSPTRDAFCQTDISLQDMNNLLKANVDSCEELKKLKFCKSFYSFQQ